MKHKHPALKPRDVNRLNQVRGPQIERVRNTDKRFPNPDDPTIEHTDVPADFTHPANRDGPRGKARRILPD